MIAATLVVAYALITISGTLQQPFIGDDYVFLDRVRDLPIWRVFSRDHLDFGWYRPWSRDVHFKLIHTLFGANEVAFRAANVMLWLGSLAVYRFLARRIAGDATAWIATIALAGLALWGSTLTWVSGSQDLWMVLLATGAMYAFARRRTWLSCGLLALALLSKELAVIVPALALAYGTLIDRRPLRGVLARCVPLLAVVGVWAATHPTLWSRLDGSESQSIEMTRHGISGLPSLGRTALLAANLDKPPAPAEVTAGVVAAIVVSSILLALAGHVALKGAVPSTPTPSRNVVAFGLLWAGMGWAPMVFGVVGWHAYYAGFGMMGAWLALATLLARRPPLVPWIILVLALLRGVQAHTPTWDWGSEWYQLRAGRFLTTIREQLLETRPILPAHSRVYFAHIPNNIGLVAGQSPALRVWYRDSTIYSNFYSEYRPRIAGRPRGADLFFRFDTLTGLVEVPEGPESAPFSLRAAPQWEHDRLVLATMFLKHGEYGRAAAMYDKLSQPSDGSRFAIFAGVCYELAGDVARARESYLRYAAATSRPLDDVLIEAAAYRRQLPAS